VYPPENKIVYKFGGFHNQKHDHDLYSLRYAEFVVPLVKAVQELDAENTQLKSTLADVLAQLSDIKNQLSELNTNQQQCAQSINSNQNTDAQFQTTQASLQQNTPNPFYSTTVIRYYIPSFITHASLVVTNASGQILKTIVLNERGSGQTTISAGTLAAGNYFYSLIIDGKTTATKQMVLTK
jgi:DNA repair exonuclease SbcCD ATPase subunit